MIPNSVRVLLPRKGTYSGEVTESVLTNLLITGLQVVSGVLLARLLGPEGRGELAAIQALPGILGALGLFGLHDAIIYFGSQNRIQVGKYVASATTLIAVLGVPVILIGVMLMPWFLKAQSPSIIFASQIYLALLYANAINGISVSTARALHKISLWNRLRVIPPVLWVLGILVFSGLGMADPSSIASTYLVLYTLASLLMIRAVRDDLRGHWQNRVSLWLPMFRYGLPSAAGTTPQFLNQRLDQLLIAATLPPRELGLYAVAISWSSLAMLPGNAMSAVAFSKIAAIRDPSIQKRFIKKAALVVLFATSVFAIVLAFVAPLAIRWIFGIEFAESSPLAIILLLCATLRVVSKMLQESMKGVGQPIAVMYSEWVGLGVLAAALAVLLPAFGVSGAAWSAVGSGAASVIVIGMFVRRWARRNPASLA